MLNLFYNYLIGSRVSESGGVAETPIKLAYADYMEAMLIVYSSGTTRMDLSSVDSWRGGVDVDASKATKPLVRLLPAVFDATDAVSGKLAIVIDCFTADFRDRITTGKSGFMELYGHDSADRQIVRIRIPVTLLPAIDPPGDHDPGAVPASSVRTLNGLPGNVVIKTAAGEALPAENGVIALPEIEPGISLNGLSGAVRLVDTDGNPFEADGQDIVINAGGGVWAQHDPEEVEYYRTLVTLE